MPTIRVRAFAGMRPHTPADLLKPGEASFAQNVSLTGGDLEPLKGLTTVTTLSGTIRTIYRYGMSNTNEAEWWFQFPGDVDIVRGPNVNDTEERTYWTDGAFPKKTKSNLAIAGAPYPSASLRLGVPAPVSAGTYTVTGTATDPASTPETSAYVMTYVTSWGEESAPSPAGTVVTWRAGQSVSFTGLPGVIAGAYDIVGKRLYRATAGSNAATFRLVNTEGLISVAATTYTDNKTSSQLGEALTTRGFDVPPDNMQGLTQMANEILAGFSGNEVCFSEPGFPYAWPIKYRQAVDAPVVGMAAFDQSLFVGTSRSIYIFTGSDPATMTSERLPVEQSLVSKRSVVAMNGGVVFASPDGLMFVGPGGLRNLSDDLMTRDQWQAYNPSSIEAYVHDGKYIAFYNASGVTGGMIFKLSGEPSFTLTNLYATAGFHDRGRDALYLMIGSNLQRWDSGASLTYLWTSGVFRFPSETNMAAARVDAAAYPVTFRLYADGVLRHTHTANSRAMFRLPADYTTQRYSFELAGNTIVRGVEIATSPQELALG